MRERERSRYAALAFGLSAQACEAHTREAPPTLPLPAPSPIVSASAAPSASPPPPPLASAAPPPPIDPGPRLDLLVWSTPAEKPGEDEAVTHWITADSLTYEVKGKAEGILVRGGNDLWAFQTHETIVKTKCTDKELLQRLEPTSVWISADLSKIGAKDRVTLIDVPKKPVGTCETVMDARVSLLGSAGPYLFVDHYYHDYGGGAHGINMGSFFVWDMSRNAKLTTWERDIAPPATEVVALQKALGDGAPGLGFSGEPGKVSLTPGNLTARYGSNGRLELEVCYAVTDANLPDFGPYFSHGGGVTGNCAPAPIPPNLIPYQQLPQGVMQFAQKEKRTLRGWDLLPKEAQTKFPQK